MPTFLLSLAVYPSICTAKLPFNLYQNTISFPICASKRLLKSMIFHQGKSRIGSLLFFPCLSDWAEQIKEETVKKNLLVLVSLGESKLQISSASNQQSDFHEQQYASPGNWNGAILLKQLAKSHLINLYGLTSKIPWSWNTGPPCLCTITVYP